MQMHPVEKKSSFTSILIIIIATLLLSYAAWDAFKVRPALSFKVETVTTQFDSLRTYLKTKLPEIDSLLVVHTNQIEEQNKQLIELNKITGVLKEK